MKTAHELGFCCVLLGILTACTTYVAPAPRTVYVQAPPVQVEAPRITLTPPPPPVYVAPPPVEVEAAMVIRTENDFYEPLKSYGRWEVIPPYGRCWIPAPPEPEWRPYCNGHWQRTEVGWYWTSDEPWAWAAYHYGRWDFSQQFGWYWVPQTQWAPAWVSWHRGGGYLGWAPLQPAVRLAPTVQIDVGRIPPRAYVFVEEKRFLEPVRPKTVIVNNTTIVNKTVNITNVKIVNNTVVNEGPQTQIIEQASGRKVQPRPTRELRRQEEAVVVARKRAGSTLLKEEQVQAPPRERTERQESNALAESEKRARAAQLKALEDSQRATKQLEKKAQLESEQQARALQRQAQAESQRKAKELERTARLESQQNARELHQKAQEESQRKSQELQKAAQRQAEQHARDLQAKAQAESQKKAKESEARAQRQAEQQALEVQRKSQEKLQKAERNADKKGPGQGQRRGKQLEPKPTVTNTNAVPAPR